MPTESLDAAVRDSDSLCHTSPFDWSMQQPDRAHLEHKIVQQIAAQWDARRLMRYSRLDGSRVKLLT